MKKTHRILRSFLFIVATLSLLLLAACTSDNVGSTPIPELQVSTLSRITFASEEEFLSAVSVVRAGRDEELMQEAEGTSLPELTYYFVPQVWPDSVRLEQVAVGRGNVAFCYVNDERIARNPDYSPLSFSYGEFPEDGMPMAEQAAYYGLNRLGETEIYYSEGWGFAYAELSFSCAAS